MEITEVGNLIEVANKHTSYLVEGQKINSLAVSEPLTCNELYQAFRASFDKAEKIGTFAVKSYTISINRRIQPLDPFPGSGRLSKNAYQSRNAARHNGIEGGCLLANKFFILRNTGNRIMLALRDCNRRQTNI